MTWAPISRRSSLFCQRHHTGTPDRSPPQQGRRSWGGSHVRCRSGRVGAIPDLGDGRLEPDRSGDTSSNVVLALEVVGDDLADAEFRLRRKVGALDPDDLDSAMLYSVEVLPDDAGADDDPRFARLRPSARRVLVAVESADGWLDVGAIGDAVAVDDSGLGGLKVRTIQDACKTLVEAELVEVDGTLGARASGGGVRSPVRIPGACALRRFGAGRCSIAGRMLRMRIPCAVVRRLESANAHVAHTPLGVRRACAFSDMGRVRDERSVGECTRSSRWRGDPWRLRRVQRSPEGAIRERRRLGARRSP